MKVLIALDTSLAAESSLDFISRCKWPADVEFEIVSILEVTTGPFSLWSTEEDAVNAHLAAEVVDLAIDRMANDLPGATVYGEVLVGGIAERILAKADEIRASLIVLGHQGTSRQGGFALGGVAERIVQAAHCSVLIVKPKVVICPDGHHLAEEEGAAV
jgi:nucleotide-binding universal stress UspA family protein